VSVYDETPQDPPAPNRTPLLLGLVAVALIAAGAALYLSSPAPEAPASTAAPAEAPRRAAAPTPKKAAPEPEAAPEPAAAPRRAPAKKAPEPEAAPAPAPRADTATVVIESDVPGASVFVDREFVGTAPVTLKDVAPGTKRINLSAEGYEGVQRAVEVTAGEQTVTLRFKEVRLNTSVGVSHKHGMGGGCEGTLRATIDGLSYETSNKGDAFSLSYAQVETFEVNYLEKNLRVKQKGGKTWNFTDKNAANADKLFVFHRDVTAAREKLAKGYTAAR
jgi:hypothetical protein